MEGLNKIVNIKASLNLGLSDIVKSSFKDIVPVDRPVISTESIPDPNWVTGFVVGEASNNPCPERGSVGARRAIAHADGASLRRRPLTTAEL